MAALHLLRPGDHIVSGIDIYGGTYRIFEELLRPMGITTSYAEGLTTQSYLDALTPETRMIWVESPSNPLMRLADIRALAKAVHERGVLLCVDNTFLSPYFQRPLDLGADIVVHSTTKYLAGHSDVLGGAVITNEEKLHTPIKNISGRSRSNTRAMGLLACHAGAENPQGSHEGARSQRHAPRPIP